MPGHLAPTSVPSEEETVEKGTVPLAVLISGRGSNLQALIDAVHQGTLRARLVVVVSNRGDAGGLGLARAAGIETVVLPHKNYASRGEYDRALVDALKSR